jgi:hypothetical protein
MPVLNVTHYNNNAHREGWALFYIQFSNSKPIVQGCTDMVSCKLYTVTRGIRSGNS